MNLDYLQNVIIPARELEIICGDNLRTSQPIYVVLDLIENFCSGHSDFTLNCNEKGKTSEFGYVDFDQYDEGRVFKKSDKKMKNPEPVTRFFTDRVKAFFLTSEAAHAYLKYQRHNLSDPYVYVFHSGYANIQMDNLLRGK